MTSSPLNRRLIKVIVVVYALLLALVSLLPGSQLPTIPDWSRFFSPDKVAHFGAYALFALLLSVYSSERGRIRNITLAILAAAAYGALLEILQAVAGTGRQFDLVDMAANALGALLGGLVYLLFLQLKNYFRSRPEVPE